MSAAEAAEIVSREPKEQDAADSAAKGEANAERDRIVALVEEHGGNISKAAKALGISRNTLYKRMEQLHLKVKVTVEVEGDDE